MRCASFDASREPFANAPIISVVAPIVAFSESVISRPSERLDAPGPYPHGKRATNCPHTSPSAPFVAVAVSVSVCAIDGAQRSFARSPEISRSPSWRYVRPVASVKSRPVNALVRPRTACSTT